MMHMRFIILLIIICGIVSSCTGSEKLFLNNVEVYNKNKKPVPDALVYVEIWKNNKPVDFTFGITGPNGGIPARPSIPIVMSRRAMATYAGFAQGYSCTVISRAIVEGKYQRNDITLEEQSGNDVMSPGMLAFPFDENKNLFNKLKNPANRTLFERWLNQFSFIFNNEDALPLYLQQRLPQMKIAVHELKVFFEIQ